MYSLLLYYVNIIFTSITATDIIAVLKMINFLKLNEKNDEMLLKIKQIFVHMYLKFYLNFYLNKYF